MYNMKKITLSLTASALLAGCGGSNSIGDGVSSISGKAVDGYLKGSTICLDLSLDGLCQATEPTTDTNATSIVVGSEGEFSFNITAEHRAHENFDKASIVVYGGTDIDTGKKFDGKLEAPNDGEEINITPLTTLVAKAVKKATADSNLTSAQIAAQIETAKSNIVKVLGLPTGTDVGADPVQLKKGGDEKLIQASLSVQKSIQTLAKAAKTDTGNTKTEAELTEDMFEAMLLGLENAADNNVTGLDNLLEQTKTLPAAQTLMGERALASVETAKQIGKKVEDFFANTSDSGTVSDFEAEMKNISSLIEQDFTSFENDFKDNFVAGADFNMTSLEKFDDNTSEIFQDGYNFNRKILQKEYELLGLGTDAVNSLLNSDELADMKPWEIHDKLEDGTFDNYSELKTAVEAEKTTWEKEEKADEKIALLASDTKLTFSDSEEMYEVSLREKWKDGKQSFIYESEKITLSTDSLSFEASELQNGTWTTVTEDPNEEDFVFRDGNWTRETSSESIVRNDDNTELTIEGDGKVTKLYETPLEGETYVTGRGIDVTVDMPAGSKEFALKFEVTEDTYFSFSKVENRTDENNSTPSYFTSFSELITTQCGNKTAIGNHDGGFTFAGTEASSGNYVCDGNVTSGNLFEVKRDSNFNHTVVKEGGEEVVVGTWEIQDIDVNNKVLVISPTNPRDYNDYYEEGAKRIFTLRDGNVHYGGFEPKGSVNRFSTYNDIAMNAIKAQIKTKVDEKINGISLQDMYSLSWKDVKKDDRYISNRVIQDTDKNTFSLSTSKRYNQDSRAEVKSDLETATDIIKTGIKFTDTGFGSKVQMLGVLKNVDYNGASINAYAGISLSGKKINSFISFEDENNTIIASPSAQMLASSTDNIKIIENQKLVLSIKKISTDTLEFVVEDLNGTLIGDSNMTVSSAYFNDDISTIKLRMRIDDRNSSSDTIPFAKTVVFGVSTTTNDTIENDTIKDGSLAEQEFNEKIESDTIETIPFVNNIFEFNDIHQERHYDENLNKVTYFPLTEKVSLNNGSVSFVKEKFDTNASSWSADDNNDTSMILTANGWIDEDTLTESYTINSDETVDVNDGNGTFSLKHINDIGSKTIEIENGLNLSVYMPTGSREYFLSYTNNADLYEVFEPVTNHDTNNTVDTLSNFMSASISLNHQSTIMYDFSAGSTNGTMVEKNGTKVGGTWELVTVHAKEILVIKPSNQENFSFNGESGDIFMIYTEISGKVYRGGVEKAGYKKLWRAYNNTAIDAIKAEITSSF